MAIIHTAYRVIGYAVDPRNGRFTTFSRDTAPHTYYSLTYTEPTARPWESENLRRQINPRIAVIMKGGIWRSSRGDNP